MVETHTFADSPRAAYERWLQQSEEIERMDKLRERWLADDNGRRRKIQ